MYIRDRDTTFVAYLDEQKAPWWGAVMGLPGAAIGGVKSLFSDKEEEEGNLSLIHIFAGCIGTYTPLCGICPFRNVRLASPEVYGSPAADCLSVDL